MGGTYTSQTPNADAQRCIGWYPENNESGDGKSSRILLPTPGLSLFGQVGGKAQGRGELAINGRGFTIIDAVLYEILANGVLNPIGAVANDGNMASFVASPQQLAVASGGLLYIYQLQTQAGLSQGTGVAGTFVLVPPATFVGPVSQVGYNDGFFVALVANSEQFYVSASFDATNWAANGSKIISTYPDNAVSMIVDHREIWLLGAKASETEYDSGNIFPFDTIPGGFIEQGCGAAAATVQLDNSIFWIGSRNDQGNAIAWRANGYSPQRISTHAVETAWQNRKLYPTIADARAFPYQDQGHSFWVITFPSAKTTWVYDVASGFWHERAFWNVNTGMHEAALPQGHMFLFGKHLVGDRQSGMIYEMSIPVLNGTVWKFADDNGNPIRRLRRAPHVSTEQEWIRHHQLQVDLETGLGPQPPLLDGMGNPRGPMVTLRYSDDGGHSWSNGQDRDCGQAGDYRKRVIWRRLGRSRDRIYELTASDPVPYRIVDAYLKASPGYAPQERLIKQASKVA